MASTTPKPVHSLILDAAPILTNNPSVSTLIAQAEQLYSVPAVIEEIRDAAARSRLETTLLPFIKLRVPGPKSMKAVTDFARRTGDLEVLSRPDIQILALAYELECERNHGDWRLRSLPGQKRVNGPPPKSLTDPNYVPGQAVDEEKREEGDLKEASAPGGAWGAETSAEQKATEEGSEEAPTQTKKASEKPAEEISQESPGEEAKEEIAETARTPAVEAATETLADLSLDPTVATIEAEEVVEEEAEDDDGEWITPTNIKKHQLKDDNSLAQPEEEVKVMQCATITGDFAMQNVLLRMNLNLLSPSLQRIKTLKTWVLRCHACFQITKDMGKQFCPRCGKPTLLRTSCSTDKDGKFSVHLKKNMQWNTRGNVYSIPKPVAGSSNTRVQGGGQGHWGHELILAEDQKEYVKAMTTEKRRKERDLMDEDYLPGLLSGERRNGGNRIKVGAGRNVNAKKRHH
jgi:RNA-binding protein NOB1